MQQGGRVLGGAQGSGRGTGDVTAGHQLQRAGQQGSSVPLWDKGALLWSSRVEGGSAGGSGQSGMGDGRDSGVCVGCSRVAVGDGTVGWHWYKMWGPVRQQKHRWGAGIR